MNNIIAIHQPNFLPWIGYFYKILKSDSFVFLDNVQYSKNSFINRNKIKTVQGESWLTIPVESVNQSNILIKDIKIASNVEWKKKNIGTIKANYSKSLFFKEIFEIYENIIGRQYNYLIDLNINLIEFVCDYLQIEKKFVLASELNYDLNSSELLVAICNKLNANKYLCGNGSLNYLDFGLFQANKIEVVLENFKCEIYNQLWGEFINNLSILDLLFNHGKNSISYLKYRNFDDK